MGYLQCIRSASHEPSTVIYLHIVRIVRYIAWRVPIQIRRRMRRRRRRRDARLDTVYISLYVGEDRRARARSSYFLPVLCVACSTSPNSFQEFKAPALWGLLPRVELVYDLLINNNYSNEKRKDKIVLHKIIIITIIIIIIIITVIIMINK